MPDYRQLFRLFSTTYFSHHRENTKEHTNVQAHTFAGIAVGWSDVANGLQVYNPITKELYTTLAVKIPSNTGSTQGYVLSVPIHWESPSLIHSDPNYTIQLTTGGTAQVPTSAMDAIIDKAKDSVSITLPEWLTPDGKVRYTIGCTTHQGRLHPGAKNKWRFTARNRLGSIIKELELPNLPFTFQTLINNNILQPGWITHFPTVAARHVSAKDLQNPFPTTLSKALDKQNANNATWLQTYTKEFCNRQKMNVYEEIFEDHLRKIQHKCGRPIPTMCVLTIKYKDGYPGHT